MSEANQIRESVSAAYARAIAQPDKGCCGGSCGGDPKGIAARTAGYSESDVSAAADVASSSFGCGNPLAFGEVREGETVLDLGSGAGFDLLIAAKKVGPRGKVIGVDMTDAMIERARANAAAAGATQVEVRKGIIEDLPVESTSVDWVISNCVVNLSPEKDRVFAEIARVLKPGGRMLISDIVVEDLPDWVRENELARNACVAGAISEGEYIAGLERAGLENVEARARFVYDLPQLAELVRSDLPGDAAAYAALAERAARDLTGKVASVQFVARKAG